MTKYAIQKQQKLPGFPKLCLWDILNIRDTSVFIIPQI